MQNTLTILGAGSSAGTPVVGCECATCLSRNPRNIRTRCSSLITLKNGKNILIDTSPDLREQSLRESITDVDAVLFTHAHADHAGGAAVLKDRFGVQIYAGDQTADMLEAGDDVKNGLARARDAGIYPSDYRFRAAAVDRRVAEYEVITINDVCISVYGYD